jgi:uncharacterized OB-fold protein
VSPASAKPAPQPTPETAEFFEGTKRGELLIQRCAACSTPFFYPRTSCPNCGSGDVAWIKASGRARLHTYVINHRPAPGFEDDAPYAIAVVELEEGPRMMTNIVGIENTPENLVLDMDLVVQFSARGDHMVPVFAPAAT